MKESQIEAAIRKYAIEQDCIVRKFTSPGKRDVHDRIIISPYGVTGFMEVKRPEGEVRPGQLRENERLCNRGTPSAIVLSVAEGKRFIDRLCKYRLLNYNNDENGCFDQRFED